MQEKKTGQISSNTLSLRFMKNAAKAQQDRDVDETKTRVRNEEQWELSPELWKRESQAQVDTIVSYEQSYIPFLFPSPKTETPITSNGDQEETSIVYKGRRKFGKHKAEVQVSEPIPGPSQKEKKPRLHAISSHGRAAASSSSRPQQQQHSSSAVKPESQVFLRPQVDAPKSQKRANANDSPSGERKKKRRKKEQRPS